MRRTCTDPATITASRGSLFALPVVRLDSPTAVEQWVAGVRRITGRCMIVGADEQGHSELSAHDFTLPTVVLLGNEARGLGRAYLAMCDALVRIPMTGSASSLNVSVAGSIVAVRGRSPATGRVRLIARGGSLGVHGSGGAGADRSVSHAPVGARATGGPEPRPAPAEYQDHGRKAGTTRLSAPPGQRAGC